MTSQPYPMTFKQSTNADRHRSVQGYTLAEVLMAAGVTGIMFVSLYGAFAAGFAVLRATRENLRATQILEERMEVIRLVKWDDVKPGFIPTTFTAPYDENSPATTASAGLAYHGTVSLTNVPMSEAYAADLRMVQIDLTWNSGNATRKRQMITYVSKYGLQNHIY